MRVEGRRCSVHDGGGRYQPGRHPRRLGHLQDGDYGQGIQIHPNGPVIGLHARTERRSPRRRVRDQIIAAVTLVQSDDREALQVQLVIVAVQSGTNLTDAHSIADHKDDVLRSPIMPLKCRNGRSGNSSPDRSGSGRSRGRGRRWKRSPRRLHRIRGSRRTSE